MNWHLLFLFEAPLSRYEKMNLNGKKYKIYCKIGFKNLLKFSFVLVSPDEKVLLAFSILAEK